MARAKQYQGYPAEFKRMALVRASEEGMTDKKECDELGISTRQFRRWRDEFRLLGDDAFLKKRKERNKIKHLTVYESGPLRQGL
ncbi:MAG: helix-turn-helix domain-containing protein [Maribacter sp.]|nr:helix-turn-helix domain-containing protein [Maribacter sp.]